MSKSLQEAMAMSIFSEGDWWGGSLHHHSFGSNLTGLKREKRPNAILQNSKTFVEKALKWLVDTDVCSSFIVSTYFENNILNIKVILKTKNEEKEMIFVKDGHDYLN